MDANQQQQSAGGSGQEDYLDKGQWLPILPIPISVPHPKHIPHPQHPILETHHPSLTPLTQRPPSALSLSIIAT